MTKEELQTHLQALAGSLPDTTAGMSFGTNPTFRVGKRTFAVIDRYSGTDYLYLKIAPELRQELLAMRGWRVAPYDPHQKALLWDVHAIDPDTLDQWVMHSFRQVALKRTIAKLEQDQGQIKPSAYGPPWRRPS